MVFSGRCQWTRAFRLTSPMMRLLAACAASLSGYCARLSSVFLAAFIFHLSLASEILSNASGAFG
jgi:hypothetical protein